MPSFKIIGLLVLEKKFFLKVFTIYGHGGHLGHLTWTIYINFRSPFSRRHHMKFDFDWPCGFRGEDVLKWLSYTCIYIRDRGRHPLGQSFFH